MPTTEYLAAQISAWETAKANLDHWKQVEAQLRREICHELLKGKEPGAHKYTIEEYPVTATRKLTYSLDQVEIGELMESGDLEPYEEECINTKYSLKLREYRALGEFQDMSRLESLITTKDAMPTLEIRET